MGCTSSKESAPDNSKRAKLYGSDTSAPTERYLLDPPRKHVTFEVRSNDDTHGSGEAARPKETFEAYARRGGIRKSALCPDGKGSRFTESLEQKKRVGGYEKYTRE